MELGCEEIIGGGCGERTALNCTLHIAHCTTKKKKRFHDDYTNEHLRYGVDAELGSVN